MINIVNCMADVASYCLIHNKDVNSCVYIGNNEHSDGNCMAVIVDDDKEADTYCKDYEDKILEEVLWLREGWALSDYDCPHGNNYRLKEFDSSYVNIYRTHRGLLINLNKKGE